MNERFAIVVAAGQGRRMGFKKQFIDLAGRPMWLRSVEAMLQGGAMHVTIVAGVDDVQSMTDVLDDVGMQLTCTVVAGGDSRHASVVAGVRHIFTTVEQMSVESHSLLIAVHDAARPFVAAKDVERVYFEAEQRGAAILGRFCRDTVKWVEAEKVVRTLPREQLFLAETPQVIRGDLAERVYLDEASDDTVVGHSPVSAPTDDSSLLEALGVGVACVESTSHNGKVTTPDDLEYATWLAKKLWEQGVYR